MYKNRSQHDKYMKIYKKERTEFLKARKLCVQCGSAVFEGRTMCPECLDKTKESSERTRTEASREQRRQYLKNKRERCIEQGICRECLKRKATVGLKCSECHVKEVKRNESKRVKVKRNMRTELGLCYFCGESAEYGFKTCKVHHEIVANNIKCCTRDNSKHIWRRIQSSEVRKIQYRKNQNTAS